MVLSYKLQKEGASEEEIERAMYLAALSQFCIYNPANETKPEWPLRHGDPLHGYLMTKASCTLHDFQRALRARDPLGWGFDDYALLHLIWQLLAWDPKERMSSAQALQHPYFRRRDGIAQFEPAAGAHNALESQMLDPRMDFNISDSIDEFVCPKCGRTFSDWRSCHTHANSRRHGKFCTYDHSTLPTCLNAHRMLPAHLSSGYCDIQGRRRTIEDFHAIHLKPTQQFYGIFDGHLGNLASKYAASFLYGELSSRLVGVATPLYGPDWKQEVEERATEAFAIVHGQFIEAIARLPHGFMDQSGTTATALLVTENSYVVTSLGDTRAVLSSQRRVHAGGNVELVPLQLTKDHVASDNEEKRLVETRGGQVLEHNNMYRVGGTLAITRSIGDARLSQFLSRRPHVIALSHTDIMDACGGPYDEYPCFMILASDGLWDMVSNQEAVDLVAQVLSNSSSPDGLQQSAEALTHEAYVRGSTDNIGVCVIAIN